MDLTVVLQIGAVVLGLVGGAGLVAGQFRKGLLDELRASLNTACTEINVHEKRAQRLDAAVNALTIQVASLEAANATLTVALGSGAHLAPEIKDLIVENTRLMVQNAAEVKADLALAAAEIKAELVIAVAAAAKNGK